MIRATRNWSRQREAAFRDRTTESRSIEAAIAEAVADPAQLVIFEVVGTGGAGKSRFLAEVVKRATLRGDVLIAAVPLSLEAEATEIEALLALRRQLGIGCHRFDVAVRTYWTVTDQPLRSIDEHAETLTDQVANAAGSGVPPPQDLAAQVFAEMHRVGPSRRDYTALQFAEIDSLRGRPEELRSRLPGYLGEDLRFARPYDARGGLLLVYDGYEKQSPVTLKRRAPWLRELIGAAGAGVHVIASRVPLQWDVVSWGSLKRVRLGRLPDQESRRLIRRELGDQRPDVENALIAATGGVAFFLLAAIDVCRVELDDFSSLRPEDLPSSQPEALDRLLDHLPPPERMLLVALAALQTFDEPLYGYLVRALDLADRVVGIDDFIEWFFVSRTGGGAFRTHDLLTAAVRESAAERWPVERALEHATRHLAARADDAPPDGVDQVRELFTSLVEAWQALPSVPVTAVELLVDIGYTLYDAGYWDALLELPVRQEAPAEQPARVVAQFFPALAARRRQGTGPALTRLEPLEPYKSSLGRHANSLDIELAYLRELRGDYAGAREVFEALNVRAHPYDPLRRDHVRSRLNYADVLTMGGDLPDASRLLEEASEPLADLAPHVWAELVRHRAHAHRFSLDFEKAEHLYMWAHRATDHAPGMRAKLTTNLAETWCWTTATDGLRAAERAIDLNGRLGSGIEICKAESALAVALARLDRFNEATAACDRALERARHVGYPAGECFAHQARVLIAVRSHDHDEADRTYWELVAGVEALGTYGHLCVLPARLRGDHGEQTRWSAGVRWIPGVAIDAELDRIAEG